MFATVMTQVLPQQDDQFCRFYCNYKSTTKGSSQSKLGEFAPLGNNKFANKAKTNKLDFVKDEQKEGGKMRSMHMFQKFKLE